MHEGEGFGAVAVDADGIGLQGYGASVVGLYGTLRCHLQDPRNGGILVLDHCAGSAAWHKAAVGLVAAVCKYLAGNGQSDGVCGLDHLAAGERQQHSTGSCSLHSAADGRRQHRIPGGHVVQRAVRFDVVQRYARRVAECLQRTDLVHHVGLGFGGGNCHSAAAKALQIRQSRVCTHLHAVLFAQQNALLHYGRIARVEPAGNVRAGHIGQNFGIHADGVRAEALAQVAV